MSEFNKKKPLRLFEAFAGYGSQAMAHEVLKREHPEFEFEVVGIAEIDKYALQAYGAVHGHCPNYGDISKVETSELFSQTQITVTIYEFFGYQRWADHKVGWDLVAGPVGCENFARKGGAWG